MLSLQDTEAGDLLHLCFTDTDVSVCILQLSGSSCFTVNHRFIVADEACHHVAVVMQLDSVFRSVCRWTVMSVQGVEALWDFRAQVRVEEVWFMSPGLVGLNDVSQSPER